MRVRYKPNSEFWELVKARLEAAPQVEEEAAKELGVSQASFNRWRRRNGIPVPTRYRALAKWLGTDEATVGRAVDRQRIAIATEHERRQASQRILS